MAELAALGAALCWAIGGLFAANASRAIGGIAYTRLRMVCVLIMLLCYLGWQGYSPVPAAIMPSLIASGFVGIFIGDTALFVALSRLGPRRSSVLFATNAPMTAALSWLLLDETLSARGISGCLLVCAGVTIAIIYGKRREQIHQWETVQGRLWVGVCIGLLAAFCQSVGSLLAKPALSMGVDAATASTLRIAVALIALYALRIGMPTLARPRTSPGATIWLQIMVSGLFGMAIGMTLLLYAFAHGQVGMSAVLSSTTPVILIPLLWIASGERPAAAAWLGAILAVVGTALLVFP